METIDIKCLEWFDKVNGISYFSALVTIDHTLPSEKIIKVPFQYGYEDQYIYVSIGTLVKMGLLPLGTVTTRNVRECGIEINRVKITALQRECKNLVK